MNTTRSTSSPTSSGLIDISEPQPRFAGAIGDFFDPAVEDEPVAIEDDLLDLERDQLGADRLADLARDRLLRLVGELRLEPGLEVRRRREHAVRDVVDRL